MNQTITLVFALITYAISFSKSTNLDREYFKISYVKLPSKPIILDNSKRTYSSNKRAISLSGFSIVNSNGTLDINFNGTKIEKEDNTKRRIRRKRQSS